ncbi:MAG: hypothetical protein ACXWX0_02730, partial [Actinomycetota bacterium]
MPDDRPVRPIADEPPAAAAVTTATTPRLEDGGPGGDGARFKAAKRARRIDRYLIPALAVVLALAIGALIIVFSDGDLLRSWSGFFNHPGETLRLSWDAVYESYRALLEGAIGSPVEIGSAIGSADIEEIEAAFRPLSETLVVTTPLIFAGLAVALGFQAGLFNIGAEG